MTVSLVALRSLLLPGAYSAMEEFPQFHIAVYPEGDPVASELSLEIDWEREAIDLWLNGRTYALLTRYDIKDHSWKRHFFDRLRSLLLRYLPEPRYEVTP